MIDEKTKEIIDYEIHKKRQDKEENLKSWGCALIFSFSFIVILFIILALLSEVSTTN